MECQPLFLDCQGKWDLIGEAINLTLTSLLLFVSFRNAWRLHRSRSDRSDAELQDSRTRKLRINFMCGIFLISLQVQIIFSISSYLIFYSEQSEGLVGDSKQTASILYKITEIIVVNFLNCLIVMVASLYWRAVRVHFIARGFELEMESSISGRWFYKKSFKRIFNWLYIGSLVCVVSSAVLLFIGSDPNDKEDYTIENILNFIIILASISIFIYSRVRSFKVQMNNSEISNSQLKKQYVYVSFIVLTCILRIVFYFFGMLNYNVSYYIRKYDDECVDTMYYNAIYVTSLTIFVNLCPPFIFTLSFSASPEQLSSSLTRTLTEEEYNSQFSSQGNSRLLNNTSGRT